MKFVMASILAMFVFAFNAYATVTPVVGNIVNVGCALPGPTGALVYSVDATVVNGSGTDTITLPSSVVTNASCTLALNALNGVACGSGHWSVAAPVSLIAPNSSYSLQQYTVTCQ